MILLSFIVTSWSIHLVVDWPMIFMFYDVIKYTNPLNICLSFLWPRSLIFQQCKQSVTRFCIPSTWRVYELAKVATFCSSVWAYTCYGGWERPKLHTMRTWWFFTDLKHTLHLGTEVSSQHDEMSSVFWLTCFFLFRIKAAFLKQKANNKTRKFCLVTKIINWIIFWLFIIFYFYFVA